MVPGNSLMSAVIHERSFTSFPHTHTRSWKVLSLALHTLHLMPPSHLCDDVTWKGLKVLHFQEEVSGSKPIP